MLNPAVVLIFLWSTYDTFNIIWSKENETPEQRVSKQLPVQQKQRVKKGETESRKAFILFVLFLQEFNYLFSISSKRCEFSM